MKVHCDYCGKELDRKPSWIKRHKHQFCNKDHFDKWQCEHEQHRSRLPPPYRICPDCGGPKSFHAKLCWQCYLLAPRKQTPGPAPKVLSLETLQPFLDAEIANYRIAKILHVNPRVVLRSLKDHGIKRDLRHRPCSREQKRMISKANKGRKRSPEFCQQMSETAAQRTGSDNPFYGCAHSQETKEHLSKLASQRPPNWHRGIYQSSIAGQFKYQSSFELRFAKVLDALNWSWERNRDAFGYLKADGTESLYTPDFKVYFDGQTRYFETKGYFPKSVQRKVQQAQSQAPIIVLTCPLIEMFERYAKIKSQDTC